MALSASAGTPASEAGEAGALVKGAKAIVADYSWYGDGSAEEYAISTSAQLFGFANIANGKDGQAQDLFKGKTVKLACDIDLGGATWAPIETFAGTLDGCSHAIKNFVMGFIVDAEGYQHCGFFKDIAWPDGLVRNLTIQDVEASVSSLGRFGTVAYCANGGNDKDYTDHQITNVHVKNVKVTSTSGNACVGGMFCETSRSFKDCTVENLTVNAPNGSVTIGGFVSFVYANNQRFQNCEVKGFTLTAEDCYHGDGCGVGGFAGCMKNTSGWTNYFEKCSVEGLDATISGSTAWAGGFVGTPCANIIATDCSAAGTINAAGAKGGFIGGFMGNYGWKAANDGIAWLHDLSNCSADVDIVSGGAPAGGFIGSASTSNGGSKYGNFKNCIASGDVTNENGVAGGFAGDAASGRFSGCSATGAVTGKIAGGFIGEARDYTPKWGNIYFGKIGNANEIALSDCSVPGSVLGSEYAGGLVGKVGPKRSVDVDGSNGQLTISASSVSGTVVAATSNAVASSTVNEVKAEGEASKVNSSSVADDEDAKVVVPPAGTTLSRGNDGSIALPEGTSVNGDSAALPAGGIINSSGALVPRVKALALDKDSLSLAVGASGQLVADVDPDGCELTWTSDDEGIAVVDEHGVVTGVSVGQTIVTVSSGDLFATCEVTVTEKAAPADEGKDKADDKAKADEKAAPLAKTGDETGIVFTGLGAAAAVAAGACVLARRKVS